LSDSDNLTAALARHQIQLPPEQVALLDRFREELWSWNERINLTRHTDYEKFVVRDVVDSLELARQIGEGETVLDVGTGGGVPGVILAIIRPDLQVSLCDSVAKKAKAVEAIVAALNLPIAVAHARAEDLLDVTHYDTLVARAVAPLHKMLTWLGPYWADRLDQLLVIKGPRWVDERGEARHRGTLRDLELRRVASYQTPGTDAENVILRIWPKQAKR
jgi:16S rRNA (guanine527-N7)-methyltransferase